MKVYYNPERRSVSLKIKEVIEKTGLTDRAIRLYIDEGLAVPSIAENYSGRKSIEFSESDVERLKNIALLRKAGFSIAEIKSIVDDKDTAKSIIENFIEKTEKNIADETEIVERLKNISFDEEVTFETICNSLSAAVEEKQVPREDMYYKQNKRFAKGFGISVIVITALLFVASILILKQEYKHIYFNGEACGVMLFSFSGMILMSLFAVVIIIVYSSWSKSEKGIKIRRKVSDIAAAMIWILGFPSLLLCFFGMTMLVPIFVWSQTDNTYDYLVLDSITESLCGEEIHALFPEEIPSFSDGDKPTDIKYFYKYENTSFFSDRIDVVAEWSLSKKNFDEAKRNAPVSIGENKAVTKQKGDWMCVYYADVNEIHLPNQGGYYFVNFAYNDELQKVRYIVCYDGYEYPEDAIIYNSLDW